MPPWHVPLLLLRTEGFFSHSSAVIAGWTAFKTVCGIDLFLQGSLRIPGSKQTFRLSPLLEPFSGARVYCLLGVTKDFIYGESF